MREWEQALVTGARVCAAAGLLAGGYAYAAMWPSSQIFGRTLLAPARPGEVALTFDDGPNPAWTPRLLDSLARYDVKATFFLVGKFAAGQRPLVRAMAEAGHLLGNHTWEHPNLARCGAGRIREELRRTKDLLEQISGKPVRYFRPPFGARRPLALREARAQGMTPVLWNAMTNDWAERGAEKIAATLTAKIEAAARRGRAANVVLHDGGHLAQGTDRGPSVAAAEQLLAQLTLTCRFVTLQGWDAAP